MCNAAIKPHEFDLTDKHVNLYEISPAVEPHVMWFCKRPIVPLCWRNDVAVCGDLLAAVE
jgi:hypothetical protein